MYRIKCGFMQLMVLTAIAGLMFGCASKPTTPTGAYAHAEKGGPTQQPGPVDTGPTDTGPTERPQMAGQELPMTQLPDGESLCDRIHFDYDKSEIKNEFEDCLNNIARWLNNHPEYILIVEGHCDERGTNEYNMALGERRANSAANFITSRGVPSQRIITRSKGEEEPLRNCSNESCWSVNRRAEFYGVQQAR